MMRYLKESLFKMPMEWISLRNKKRSVVLSSSEVVRLNDWLSIEGMRVNKGTIQLDHPIPV